MTISNINSDHPEIVNVYDSMFSYSSPSLRAQVASLLHTDKPNFVLNFVDVHKQNGHDDCGGIFSITYSYSCIVHWHASRNIDVRTRSHASSFNFIPDP